MKLDYITLRNFRQYYGEQTLYFATDEDRCVTVVNGINGAGKTSLCIAVNWCLYGEKVVEKRFGQIGELASKHPLPNIMSNETSVKIGFTYQGTKYWAEREHSFSGGTVFQLGKEGNDYSDPNSSEMILSMIPEDVSEHFFFDGEKIDNFARPGHEKEVKNAVLKVLKVEVIERGIKHLRAVSKDYDQNLAQELSKEFPGDLKMMHDKKEEAEKEKNELSTTMTEKREEVKEAEKQIQDIDKRLQAIEKSRELAENRKRIEHMLEQFRQDKSEVQAEIGRIANDGFIPMAKPVVDEALEILNKNQSLNVPEAILKDLLKRMRCLCDRDIHDKSPEHQRIQALLEETASSQSRDVVRDTHDALRVLFRSQVKEIPANLKSALSNSQKLERNIAKNMKTLKDIEGKIADFDLKDVRDLQKTRSEYERKIGNLESEIHNLKSQIKDIDVEINGLTKKIRKAEVSADKAKQLKRYWELAEDALKATEKIHSLFAEDMREKIQPKIQEIFKKLVWKESHFQSVHLSEEFELQVIDRFGEQARPEMSAGERQVLSLAFIAAMAKVAVEEIPLNMADEPFPIVMDTPFGRLASEPRENITETIPEIAQQLILFVTDTELVGKARANLEPRIGKEYRLQFDQETSVTTIEPIA